MNVGLLPPAGHAGQRLLHDRLRRSRRHVAHDDDRGAAGLEVVLVERHHVVTGDGLQRLLGDQLPEGVVGPVEHLREHPAGDRAGLRLRAVQRDEPLRAEPFERWRRERRVQQHVREDVERRGELAARRHEAHRAGLAADTRVDRRAERLQRVRQRLAVARRRAFAQHRGRQAGHAAPVGRLELVGPAHPLQRERDERQVVLLGDEQLDPVGERRLRPGRDAKFRRLAGQAGPSNDREPAAPTRAGQRAQRGDEDDSRQPSNEGVHYFTSGRGVSSAPVTFLLCGELGCLYGLAVGHHAQDDAAFRQVLVGDALDVRRGDRRRLLVGRLVVARVAVEAGAHRPGSSPCRGSTRGPARSSAPRRQSPSGPPRPSAPRPSASR